MAAPVPVPVPFLWTLDLGFGTWIWDLDLGLGFGTLIWDLDLGLDLGLTISKLLDRLRHLMASSEANRLKKIMFGVGLQLLFVAFHTSMYVLQVKLKLESPCNHFAILTQISQISHTISPT